MTILSLPDPYKGYPIRITKEGYEFESDSGLLYFMTFTSYPALNESLSLRFLNFNIECIEGSPKFDPKVKCTVIGFLKEFFKKHEDAIITIYDVSDNRQDKRKKLFDRWYKSSNDGSILKKEYPIKTDDIDSLMCLYYSSNNPLGKEYINQISELKNLLFS